MTVERQLRIGAKQGPTQQIVPRISSPYSRSCQKNYPYQLVLSCLYLVKQSLNFLVITRGSVSSSHLQGSIKKVLLRVFRRQCDQKSLWMILAKYEWKYNLLHPSSTRRFQWAHVHKGENISGNWMGSLRWFHVLSLQSLSLFFFWCTL